MMVLQETFTGSLTIWRFTRIAVVAVMWGIALLDGAKFHPLAVLATVGVAQLLEGFYGVLVIAFDALQSSVVRRARRP
jgi:hypothetical protein